MSAHRQLQHAFREGWPELSKIIQARKWSSSSSIHARKGSSSSSEQEGIVHKAPNCLGKLQVEVTYSPKLKLKLGPNK